MIRPKVTSSAPSSRAKRCAARRSASEDSALAIASPSPGTAQLRLDRSGLGGEMLGVRGEQLGRPGVAQAGAPVFPERLEQLVAGRATRLWTHGQHGALGEPGQQVEGVASRGHRLCRAQIEGSGEHRQRSEEGPFVGLEHVVGPADGVVHGAVPRIAPPSHRLEYSESLVEAVGDFGNADRTRPCRSQLNRQRDPVEASTDLDDQRRRDLVQDEGRVGGLGSSDEERDRGDLGQFGERHI